VLAASSGDYEFLIVNWVHDPFIWDSCRAGAGAVPGLQNSGSAAVQDARDKVASNVQKTKKRIDNIFQSKVVNHPQPPLKNFFWKNRE
jgi:hypothetical protein